MSELIACYFCEQMVDAYDYRCSGCGEIICGDCNGLSGLWGDHKPEDHHGQ